VPDCQISENDPKKGTSSSSVPLRCYYLRSASPCFYMRKGPIYPSPLAQTLAMA